jgi:hypothetical protein
MAIKLAELKDGKILEAAVSGHLTDGDYQRFVPEFERLTRRHGKIRVLFEMRDFHGWEIKAAWEDLKFDWKHYRDIDRIAVVGEKKWQRWTTVFFKPFTAAETRYFDIADREMACLWIEEQAV